MKSVYKLCFSALLGLLLFFICVTVAHAESSNDVVVCNGFNVGDTAIYYVENLLVSGKTEVMDYSLQITESNKYICMYISTGGTVSGYALEMIGFENGGLQTIYDEDGNIESSYVVNVASVKPHAYSSPYWSAQGILFNTNIPIFEDYATASSYVNNKDDSLLTQAVNYKKVYENGNWVKPFEDIEINDSDILVPDLSNISHTGFTVTNCKDERYVVEIYMESGLEKPENYINQSRNVEDALFVNAFGLITDNSEAYYNGPTFDIAQLYGIDNYTALMNSINSFYTTYPSGNSYPVNEKASNNYFIWGKPFGKIGAFFSNGSKVSADELLLVTPADVPICYTQYKVRYFYYDDSSGYHYGPWGVYTYFSDGNVVKSSIFQSNTGDIISTPGINGSQDSDGNIGYSDDTNYVDLNNPNELFGYIRSVFNNVSSTMGNFSILFGSVFNFLPVEILAIIFLGMAVMVLVGVIRVFT